MADTVIHKYASVIATEYISLVSPAKQQRTLKQVKDALKVTHCYSMLLFAKSRVLSSLEVLKHQFMSPLQLTFNEKQNLERERKIKKNEVFADHKILFLTLKFPSTV